MTSGLDNIKHCYLKKSWPPYCEFFSHLIYILAFEHDLLSFFFSRTCLLGFSLTLKKKKKFSSRCSYSRSHLCLHFSCCHYWVAIQQYPRASPIRLIVPVWCVISWNSVLAVLVISACYHSDDKVWDSSTAKCKANISKSMSKFSRVGKLTRR